MLKTFNQADWKENLVDEAARDHLTPQTKEEELRRLFPFKARMKKACQAYKLAEGQELEYARVTQVVRYFPIEILVDLTTSPRKVMVNSTEAQVIEI